MDTVRQHHDAPTNEYFEHSSAKRVNTDVIIQEAIKHQYPDLHLAVVPPYGNGFVFDLLGFAAAGFAEAQPINDDTEKVPTNLKWRSYIPPARRLGTSPGILADRVIFGKYLYRYKGNDFFVYVVDTRDGDSAYPQDTLSYILSGVEEDSNALIRAVSEYSSLLHNQIWVFDQGYWQKSAELYASVMESSWDDVILDAEMKHDIRTDVVRFFDSQDSYARLKVPWKRGIIYYGPPGNGKTISIKAMMHTLYNRHDPIPTLYVRTLRNIYGPEYAVAEIFNKARQAAPCLLVFEDLDSIVSDDVRSYFLNEVDGIRANDGVLMLGSTNHLDRLDPGIAKRPSRFDRKYLFPKPGLPQRTAYAEFWRAKLSDNKDIEFPKGLCKEMGKITDGFSFAYMQEAFVATLLAIASRDDEDDEDDLESTAAAVAAHKKEYNAWLRKSRPAELEDAREELADKMVALLGKWAEDDGTIGAARTFGLAHRRLAGMEVGELGQKQEPEVAKRMQQLRDEVRALDTKTKSQGEFDDLLLWQEFKRQVKILRDQI